MPARTVPALVRALDRAGLTDLAALPDCTIEVQVRAGVVHGRHGCIRDGLTTYHRPVQRREVSLRELSNEMRVCEHCSLQIGGMDGHGSFLRTVTKLLRATEQVRAAQRFVADSNRSTSAGKSAALQRRLAEALQQVREVETTTSSAEVRAQASRIADDIEAAIAELGQAQRGGGQREKVLTRVRDELIPPRLRGRITLEDGRVLVGITPHQRAGQKVQEVIDAFRIAQTSAGVLLDCPRFVCDYLNRYYAAGSRWESAVVSAAADGLSDIEVKATAAMWSPHRDGPLADLATAIRAARMSMTEAQK